MHFAKASSKMQAESAATALSPGQDNQATTDEQNWASRIKLHKRMFQHLRLGLYTHQMLRAPFLKLNRSFPSQSDSLLPCEVAGLSLLLKPTHSLVERSCIAI